VKGGIYAVSSTEIFLVSEGAREKVIKQEKKTGMEVQEPVYYGKEPWGEDLLSDHKLKC